MNGRKTSNTRQKRRLGKRNKGASKKRYAWVVGNTFERIRVTGESSPGQYEIEFCEPSAEQEEAECDRCHGFRHKKTNALCSAASPYSRSPFTKDSGLYCIETGRHVGSIHFSERHLKKKGRIGTGVATVLLY